MPIVAWDTAQFGTPEARDFEVANPENRLRPEVQVGSGPSWPEFTEDEEFVSFSITWTFAQWRLWRAFYKNDLKRGGNSLSLFNPLENAALTYEVIGARRARLPNSVNIRATLRLRQVNL